MEAKRIKFIDKDGISHNFKDLTGQRFGRLTVLEVVGIDKRRGAIWKCRCDCSNEITIIGSKLTTGTTKSCGCLRRETARASCYKNHKHNLSVNIGEKYGKLTILKVHPQKEAGKPAMCLCQCDCGSNPKWIDAHSLKRGNTKSCGCIVSQGEYRISQLLKQNGVQFENQKTFSDCVNPETNTRLRFDFYLPDYNCCIEYDGIQHFENETYLRNYFTQDALNKIKYRDKIKDKYCCSHSIRLIRIPYTEYSNLTSSYLSDIINNGNLQFDVKEFNND